MHLRLLPALFLLLAAACASSKAAEQPAPRDPNAQVDALLEEAGINATTDQIAASVLTGFDSSMGPNAANPKALELRQLMAESFAAPLLRASVQEHFRTNTDVKNVEAALAFVRTPLGARLLRMEIEQSKPEHAQEMEAFLGALPMNPPDAGRMALIKRLEAAVGSTDTVADAIGAMQQPLMVSMSIQHRGLTPSTYDEVEAQISAEKARIRPQLEQQTIASMLFVYQQASDAELRDYTTFFESDVGRWLSRTTRAALKQAMNDAGKRLVKRIGEKAQQGQTTAL